MLMALTMVNGAFGPKVYSIKSKVDFSFLNSIVALEYPSFAAFNLPHISA
jgi:hypothetical protein